MSEIKHACKNKCAKRCTLKLNAPPAEAPIGPIADTAAALASLEHRQDDLLARLEQLERRSEHVLSEQADWLKNQCGRITPRTAALLKSLAIEPAPAQN